MLSDKLSPSGHLVLMSLMTSLSFHQLAVVAGLHLSPLALLFTVTNMRV